MQLHQLILEADDNQVTVSLEIFDKAEFNDSKRKFSTIKFGPLRGSSAKATGSKKDLIKFITVEMGQDKSETKEAYPELFK